MGAKIRVHESFEPLLADQASPEHLPEKRKEKKTELRREREGREGREGRGN